MKLFLYSICTLGILLSSHSQSHLYGIRLGLTSVSGTGSVTEEKDFFTLKTNAPNILNFSVTPSLFYEFRSSKLKRLGLNAELFSYQQSFSVFIEHNYPNYHQGVLALLLYRNLVFSIGPSFHLGRIFKISGGFDLQYNFRNHYNVYNWSENTDPRSPLYPFNKMIFEMNQALENNRLKPFTFNTFIAVELRIWRTGLEFRYGKSQNGNLLRSFEHNGYTHSPKYFMNDYATLSTKFYFTKIR